MFGFPLSTSKNLIKDSIGAQFSFFSAVSESVFNTSLQISELNVQAMRRLMEESASDMQRALQIKSLPETGLFLVEQSRATIEKVRGYQQNIQNIMVSNQVGLQKILEAPVAGSSGSLTDEKDSSAAAHAAGTASTSSTSPSSTSPGAGHAHHKAEHRAPPLVEKLIASAVSDVGSPSSKS